ncbi:MAG: hypothetical protein ACRCVQ_13755 [Acinetobacter ursingii]
MSLPETGRVIIIDDEIDQALPLINYLSKYRYPFKYFNGDLENLPEQDNGFDDIRLLFLDLNLVDNSIPDRTHFSKIKAVLNRVIKEVSYPYLLVVWSRHEETIAEMYDYVFDEVSGMHLKKPCHIIQADKLSYYELNGTEVTGSDFHDLKNLIETELLQFPELKSILQWENAVHLVAHQVSSEIFNLQGAYKEWAENTRNILSLFAQVSIGSHFSTSDNSTKLNSSFEVINQLFMDKLETNFYALNKENVRLSNTIYNDENSKKKINTKLLTGSIVKLDIFYPGIVKKIDDNDLKERILSKVFDKNSNILLALGAKIIHNISFSSFGQNESEKILTEKCILIHENFETLQKPEQRRIKREIKEQLNSTLHSCTFNQLSNAAKREFKADYLISTINLVESCIDPLCDYVQNKLIHSKFIQGLMLEECFLEHIDKNSEAIYISPIFNYEDRNVFLVFDYRFLFTRSTGSFNASQIDSSEFLFRLRSSLLADMQSKLSRHINRQGILYIDR